MNNQSPRKRTTFSSESLRRAFSIACAFILVTALAFPVAAVQAFAEPSSGSQSPSLTPSNGGLSAQQDISSWSVLKTAIGGAADGTETTLTISGDLVADETITIAANKNIKIVSGSQDVTITKKDDCAGALFKVEKGATLTLGSGSSESNATTVTFKGRTSHQDDAYTAADGSNAGGLFVYCEGNLNIKDGAKITEFVSEYCTAENNNVLNYCNLTPGNNATDLSAKLSPIGDYLKNCAPIYISNGGKLNMTGGEISNNRVGFPLSDAEDEWLRTNVGYGMLHDLLYNADTAHEPRRTNSAGAIILDGNGGEPETSATISGGVILSNKGDAGAIHVKAGAKLEMTEGKDLSQPAVLNELFPNVNWAHFTNSAGHNLQPTGAVIKENTGLTLGTVCVRSNEMKANSNGKYVESNGYYDVSSTGSKFLMTGGVISDNINFFRGAVSVSGDASFKLTSNEADGYEDKDPIIGRNLSCEKGGGVYVHSNSVDLLRGWIVDNKAWAMGGGVYVEGPYTMHIGDGAVYENAATFSDRFSTTELEERYAPQSDADKAAFGNTDSRYGGYAHTNDCSFATSREQFFPGSGGGIWLCPTGSLYFDASAAYLGENTAGKQGDDFFKDTGSAYMGTAGGTLIRFDDNYHDWRFDRDPVQGSGAEFDSNVHGVLGGEGQFGEQSVLALKNVSEDTLSSINDHKGVHIAFNTSRRGGGIASNGYVVFSNSENGSAYSYSVDLTVQKEWSEEIPVNERAGHLHFKAFYDHNGEMIELKDFILGNPGDSIQDDNSNQGSNLTVKNYQDEVNAQPDAGMKLDGWKATLTLPTSIYGSQLFDPHEVQSGFEEAKAKGEEYHIDSDEFRIIFVEYDHTWTNPSATYVCEPSDAEVTNVTRTTTTRTLSPDNKPINITLTTDAFAMSQTLTNHPDEPEIEKYVEKDVHADLPAFNTEYTYDIMAWVTHDATKLTITDELVDALEFAGGADDVVVTYKDVNDHKVHETVAHEGNAFEGAKATIDGQKLTVQIDDATPLQSRWVQVTFKAKIKDEYRTIESLKGDGLWATITNNGTVLLGSNNHAGVKNAAKYHITATNSSNVYQEMESNTVTVTAPEESLTVDKVWKNASGATIDWPEGAKVGVEVLGEGGKAVASATLTAEQPKWTVEHLPVLEGVTYTVHESSIDGETGYEPSVAKSANGYTITNQETPEIEKYVNQGVHSEVAWDEAFTYDVLAYVTEDADSVTVTDELVEALEYATDASAVKVTALSSNDHKPGGTVSTDGEAVAGAKATIDGQKLTVNVPDATSVRGKWLKVTFKAQIKKDYREKSKVRAQGNWAEVASNGTVLTDEQHQGIANRAAYSITAGGKESRYTAESNTVTVVPKDGTSGNGWPKTGDKIIMSLPLLMASVALLVAGWSLRRRREE